MAKVWHAEQNATNWAESTICKAKELFYMAGLDQCFEKGDKVAVKLHMGEWNRTTTIRPQYVAAIVEEIKACGGKPFVCDTTTLTYQPFNNRWNATQELQGAIRHGLTAESLGCPVIIADGWNGNDDVRVEIPEGNILKETYIGAAIAGADAMIGTAHAKGHGVTSYGGTVKLHGIGSQSRRGKYATHLAMWGDPSGQIGYPLVQSANCAKADCQFYKICEDSCPRGAVKIDPVKGAQVDFSKCYLCYSCQSLCIATGTGAIGWHPDYFPYAQIAMSDAALATKKLFEAGKFGCMNFAVDTCPECDCLPYSGLPVSTDQGIFASKDIIAIDMATLDAIDAAPIYPGSRAEDLGVQPGESKFKAVNGYEPRIAMKAGAAIGLGELKYELIEFDPKLNGETIAKWQVQSYPTTVDNKKIFGLRDYIGEIIPFKRIPFETKFAWQDWDPSAQGGVQPSGGKA